MIAYSCLKYFVSECIKEYFDGLLIFFDCLGRQKKFIAIYGACQTPYGLLDKKLESVG